MNETLKVEIETLGARCRNRVRCIRCKWNQNLQRNASADRTASIGKKSPITASVAESATTRNSLMWACVRNSL